MYLDPFGNFFPDQREVTRRAAERHAVLAANREGRAVERRLLPRIRQNASSLMSRLAQWPRSHTRPADDRISIFVRAPSAAEVHREVVEG